VIAITITAVAIETKIVLVRFIMLLLLPEPPVAVSSMTRRAFARGPCVRWRTLGGVRGRSKSL
jgi:hypothetical protein